MPRPITIPRLGWSMDEGIFCEWLKAPGELVLAGEMLFLLEGEKATTEIESLDAGRLCIPADAPLPGAAVKVGEVIGYLLAEGEPAPPSLRIHPPAPVTTLHPPAPMIAHTERVASVASLSPPASPAMPHVANGCEQRAASSRTMAQAVATPRARRRARELGVDWRRLSGTGRNGRIRERDVLAEPISPGAVTSPTPGEIPPTEPGRHAPAAKLRRIIAQRMSAGVHQAAPVTLTTKVDATALVTYREQLQAESTHGLVPSYNDILLQWTAHTLRELPGLNACWYRDGVHYYNRIHIATAVDTPAGLLAPVVRDADQLTLPEIAERTRQLTVAARAGQLNQDQLSGGTFTTSNLGMYGIDAFTPILNLPQAAILGVGRIVEEPVVRNGQLAVGQTMTLSLTFDHRVVDGAPAARWLQRLCAIIQAPGNQPGA